MVPAEIVDLDKVPLLGSGKIDNVAVTKLVKERVAAARAAAAAGWLGLPVLGLDTLPSQTETRHERQRQAVIDLQA